MFNVPLDTVYRSFRRRVINKIRSYKIHYHTGDSWSQISYYVVQSIYARHYRVRHIFNISFHTNFKLMAHIYKDDAASEDRVFRSSPWLCTLVTHRDWGVSFLQRISLVSGEPVSPSFFLFQRISVAIWRLDRALRFLSSYHQTLIFFNIFFPRALYLPTTTTTLNATHLIMGLIVSAWLIIYWKP